MLATSKEQYRSTEESLSPCIGSMTKFSLHNGLEFFPLYRSKRENINFGKCVICIIPTSFLVIGHPLLEKKFSVSFPW